MKINHLRLSPLLLLAGVAPAHAQGLIKDRCYHDDIEFASAFVDEYMYMKPHRCEGDADTGITTTTANRNAGLATTRVNTRDVGDRLFRKRAGIPAYERTTTTPAPAPAMSAKGGMAKGGMSKEPIVVTEPAKWEVWGGLFYYTEDSDAQYAFIRPNVPPQSTFVPPPVRIVVAGETDLDIFGGSAGVEYRLNNNFSLGFAMSASSADSETTLLGARLNSADIDALSFIPYVSYYRDNAVFGADYWADLMYSYTDLSYDMQRNNFGLLTTGSTDGSTHTLDFNTGLTFRGSVINHGPYVGLRWIDGEIDGYQEFNTFGPAALFPSQDIKSLASTVGYSLSAVLKVNGGAWVPQVRAAWEHEFEDNAGSVFGFPVGTVDEDIAVLGAGVGFYCVSGWNAVLDYEARLGSEVEGHYVGLKVGVEF